MTCKVDIASAIAREIIDEILEETPDCTSYKLAEIAQDMVHERCDGIDVVIYYYKAIEFCAENDTSEGQAWLEDCGGIAQQGDSFGQIACRVAYATLYCETINQINYEIDLMEDAA